MITINNMYVVSECFCAYRTAFNGQEKQVTFNMNTKKPPSPKCCNKIVPDDLAKEQNKI